MFKESKLKKALKCIDERDFKGLESILKKGFDPFYRGKNGDCIIDQFILDQDMSDLVNSYASVHGLSDKKRKAYDAVIKFDLDKLKELNPDSNQKDRTGRSLLSLAFEVKNFKAVEFFLTYAENIENERAVLGSAFANSDKSLIEKLLLKINLNELMNEELLDYLHYQTIYNNNGDGLLILLDYIDMNKEGPELFNESIRNSEIDMVRLYLSKGADPNGVFDDKTPLMAIAGRLCFKDGDIEKTIEIAKLLIENGSNPEILNQDGLKAEDIAFERNLDLGYYLRDLNFDMDTHLSMLKDNKVPKGVFEFFENGKTPPQAACDENFELSAAKFCSLNELRKGTAYISSWEYTNNNDVKDPNFEKDGNYEIPVIEFIREQKSYGENGILMWIPALSMFGCCDTDHGVVTVFNNSTFNDILADPCKYLNAQWTNFGSDIYDVCKPHEFFEYKEN